MKRAAMHSKSLFVVLGSRARSITGTYSLFPEKLGSSRKLSIIAVTRLLQEIKRCRLSDS